MSPAVRAIETWWERHKEKVGVTASLLLMALISWLALSQISQDNEDRRRARAECTEIPGELYEQCIEGNMLRFRLERK
jgi:hypothetical protein